MFQFIEAQLDYHKKAVMTLDSILPTLRSLLGKVTSHSEDKIHNTCNLQFSVLGIVQLLFGIFSPYSSLPHCRNSLMAFHAIPFCGEERLSKTFRTSVWVVVSSLAYR